MLKCIDCGVYGCLGIDLTYFFCDNANEQEFFSRPKFKACIYAGFLKLLIGVLHADARFVDDEWFIHEGSIAVSHGVQHTYGHGGSPLFNHDVIISNYISRYLRGLDNDFQLTKDRQDDFEG